MEFVHSFSADASDTQEMNAWFDGVFDDTRDRILRYIIIHIDIIHIDRPAQADDVFQEVYSSLFERICRTGFSDIREPIAFLTKMAKREIGRHRRSKSAEFPVAMDGPTLAEVPGAQSSLEDMAVDRDVLDNIQETVRQMPPLTHKVFVLHYFFDMPVAAIADELGSSVDAVKSRLSRVRAAVRQKLREEA